MREIERETEREIKISNVLIFLHINACLLKRQQTVFISTNQQNMIIRRIIHHDTLKGKSIVLLALFSFTKHVATKLKMFPIAISNSESYIQ